MYNVLKMLKLSATDKILADKCLDNYTYEKIRELTQFKMDEEIENIFKKGNIKDRIIGAPILIVIHKDEYKIYKIQSDDKRLLKFVIMGKEAKSMVDFGSSQVLDEKATKKLVKDGLITYEDKYITDFALAIEDTTITNITKYAELELEYTLCESCHKMRPIFEIKNKDNRLLCNTCYELFFGEKKTK